MGVLIAIKSSGFELIWMGDARRADQVSGSIQPSLTQILRSLTQIQNKPESTLSEPKLQCKFPTWVQFGIFFF